MAKYDPSPRQDSPKAGPATSVPQSCMKRTDVEVEDVPGIGGFVQLKSGKQAGRVRAFTSLPMTGEGSAS